MREVIYWVKFDKDPNPFRLTAKSLREFMDRLMYEIDRRQGEMPEWMIRDYK